MRNDITTNHDSELAGDPMSQTQHSIPQTATLIHEQGIEDISGGDITDLSGHNENPFQN